MRCLRRARSSGDEICESGAELRVRKQAQLQKLWSQLLYDVVHSAVLDMWDTQAYAKKCLEEVLDKS